jgi:hypothetical protein
MTTVWTARQRRVPRALVHRARPQGWAHVTCDRERKQSLKTSEPAASRSPGGRGRRQPHIRAVRARRCHPPPPHRGPTASRSPGGRGRRQPHIRPTRRHRLPSPTNEARGARRPTRQPSASADPAVAVVAGDKDAPKRHECAAGAARALPGCYETREACWTRPRFMPGGGSKTHAVCGWQLVHSSSATVFSRDHKLRAPSPVASIDAQVREGPGAAVRSDWPSFVHTCAALGPDAAMGSRCVVTGLRLCSDGRARSLTHA